MRKRGSITVFASLSLMLVAQMIFTFLEGAHCLEVSKSTQMNTDAVLESVFADYCTPLWEKYKILGASAEESGGNFSLNNREAQLRNMTRENLGGGSHLLHADMTDVEFTSYLLMSDQAGRVFEEAVCSYMKQNMGYEAAKSLYSNFESAKNLKDGYDGSDKSIENAKSALEESVKEEGQTQTAFSGGRVSTPGAGTGSILVYRKTTAPNEERNIDSNNAGSAVQTAQTRQKESTDSGDKEKNILDLVMEAKQKGVLTFVIPEGTKLSDNSLSLEKTVSHRSLQKGTGGSLPAGDWYQKVLLNQYLMNYLTCYTDRQDDRAMNYELEYLLAGKPEDRENLKVVVEELLAIREALNMASISAMPDKQEEAAALALVIAGASANPFIIEAVKYGILAAWAFVESVLDLRTLLEGGKIAMVKSEAEWTSHLSSLPELLSGWSVAKESPRGKDYKSYLGLLLYFHSEQKLSMRAMDVEEAAVRKVEGYENFQMDHLICDAKVQACYSYQPVFLGFVHLLERKNSQFQIQKESWYSYFEQKGGV